MTTAAHRRSSLDEGGREAEHLSRGRLHAAGVARRAPPVGRRPLLRPRAEAELAAAADVEGDLVEALAVAAPDVHERVLEAEGRLHGAVADEVGVARVHRR